MWFRVCTHIKFLLKKKRSSSTTSHSLPSAVKMNDFIPTDGKKVRSFYSTFSHFLSLPAPRLGHRAAALPPRPGIGGGVCSRGCGHSKQGSHGLSGKTSPGGGVALHLGTAESATCPAAWLLLSLPLRLCAEGWETPSLNRVLGARRGCRARLPFTLFLLACQPGIW